MQTVISRKVTYRHHLRGLTSVVAVICVCPMLPQLTTSIQGHVRLEYTTMKCIISSLRKHISMRYLQHLLRTLWWHNHKLCSSCAHFKFYYGLIGQQEIRKVLDFVLTHHISITELKLSLTHSVLMQQPGINILIMLLWCQLCYEVLYVWNQENINVDNG